MHASLRILLLCAHWWHFNTHNLVHNFLVDATDAPVDTIYADASANITGNLQYLAVQDTGLNLQEGPAIPSEYQQPDKRAGRQLFYNPNLLFVQSYNLEGSPCRTTRGLPGYCVRIGSCREFFRVRRQLTYWLPKIAPVATDICSFYDQYGRANNGICCSHDFGIGSGLGLAPAMPDDEIRPIPAPPMADTPAAPAPNPAETPTPSSDEGETPENTEEIVSAEHSEDPPLDLSTDVFIEQNVVYDPIKPDGDDELYKPYQWPTQFASHFSGIQQWPPPLPTHPPAPAAASWPPPLPTHPPGHHYPTHPPSISANRPTVPATLLTTTRRTSAAPTTTRRPSYPSYPGYPQYPTYPTYRPLATTTTTTTRRPVTAVGGSSSNGLPLQCGIKNPVAPDQERIVGGTNASPHEFPWIAVLFKSGKQFCGGSLITKNHILTAAHCVARMTSWDVAAMTAHLGDYNIRSDYEAKHEERRIKRLVRHKGFDFSHLHNDIAILTLNEPVKYSYEIQPICLPTSSAQQTRSYSGQTATVAGWGSLRENGPQPSILQKVDIPIWPNSECARKYGRAAPGGIIESMICAGQASKDSCSGDSGGPLIVSEAGRYTQVGIVSWGIGCGKGQYPGVYTRITALLPWIYKNIK